MKNPRTLALHAVGQRLWLGSDGWVSLEVSPLLAHDTNGTIGAAARLHAQAACANLLIKIPGTTEGIVAIATLIYKAYRELLLSDRWRKLEAAGTRPQRLVWASTGAKDPAAPHTLYVESLAAEATIDTIPEKTLLAFADHGKVSAPLLAETSYAEDLVAKFRHERLDDNAFAARLQREGAGGFAKSWRTSLARIAKKSHPVASAVSP